MAVSKATVGQNIVTLAGTLAEVAGSLNTDGIQKTQIVAIWWDSSANKVNCIYYA